MAKLLLKLLALLPLLAVAPASASHLAAVAGVGHSDCAYERAELAAAGYQQIDASSVGAPIDGSLFDPGPALLP